MTTEEAFEQWLVTVYRQSRKNQEFNTPNHYGAGIRRIAIVLGLPDNAVYNDNADLDEITKLLETSSEAKPQHFVHLKAFKQFRKHLETKTAERLTILRRQPDVFKRQQVEIAAVDTVTNHYTELGYAVHSKEKDNLGWDLEATKDGERLLLEVKGLSGRTTAVELTPNEYKHLQEKSSHYKLCIVTNALIEPELQVFGYDASTKGWTNGNGEQLSIEERIGARFWKNPEPSAPLKFEPWRGKHYDDSQERILLLGESHYINEGENDDLQFTTKVVSNHLANADMRTPFFKTIDLLFNAQESPGEFWNRIAFANLIQKGFSQASDQPTSEDIASVAPAFDTLVNTLQPTKVIVLSKRMWNYWLLEEGCQRVGVVSEGELKADMWRYQHSGGSFLAIGIKHPSRIWGEGQLQEWSSLLQKFLNY